MFIIVEPPALANRRVEQLRGDKSKPTTPESPLIPSGNRDYLQMLDTPTRESLLERFKELEDETPQTKRRRCEQAGIYTPEEATTPYWLEFKRQQLEERRTRHAPTQEQLDKIQKNRTVSAIKCNCSDQYSIHPYEYKTIALMMFCFSANVRGASKFLEISIGR